MSDKGFFGNLFDFNGDGELDLFESAADITAFNQMISEENIEEKESENDSVSTLDFSGYDTDEEEMIIEELETAGIDLDDLEYMDDDERYEALEEAGLDPDDFDF